MGRLLFIKRKESRTAVSLPGLRKCCIVQENTLGGHTATHLRLLLPSAKQQSPDSLLLGSRAAVPGSLAPALFHEGKGGYNRPPITVHEIQGIWKTCTASQSLSTYDNKPPFYSIFPIFQRFPFQRGPTQRHSQRQEGHFAQLGQELGQTPAFYVDLEKAISSGAVDRCKY